MSLSPLALWIAFGSALALVWCVLFGLIASRLEAWAGPETKSATDVLGVLSALLITALVAAVVIPHMPGGCP